MLCPAFNCSFELFHQWSHLNEVAGSSLTCAGSLLRYCVRSKSSCGLLSTSGVSTSSSIARTFISSCSWNGRSSSLVAVRLQGSSESTELLTGCVKIRLVVEAAAALQRSVACHGSGTRFIFRELADLLKMLDHSHRLEDPTTHAFRELCAAAVGVSQPLVSTCVQTECDAAFVTDGPATSAPFPVDLSDRDLEAVVQIMWNRNIDSHSRNVFGRFIGALGTAVVSFGHQDPVMRDQILASLG
jgi:hypothetical protein